MWLKQPGVVGAFLVAVAAPALTFTSLAANTSRRLAHEWSTGSGTPSDPYVGWQSAIADGIELVFLKGTYELQPTTAVVLPSNVVLQGVDGAIIQWPDVRSPVEPMFTIPAGTENVVIRDIRFEAGVSVPASGLTDGSGGGAFITIGTIGSATPAKGIAIANNHFGVMRYGCCAFGNDIAFASGAEDVVIRDNFMDSAPTNISLIRGHATNPPSYKRLTISSNVIYHSQAYENFGNVLQPYLGTYPLYGQFEHLVIQGNTLDGVNGGFNIDMGGFNLTVTDNTARSDNLDFFLSMHPPFGTQEIVGFNVASNVCYAMDPSGDPLKIDLPNCTMLLGGVDGMVIGNSIRSSSTVAADIRIAGATNVLVASNSVDMAGVGGNCYGVIDGVHVRFVDNTCIDVDGAAFTVGSGLAVSQQIEFVGNQVRTTSASPTANHFLLASGTVGDVVVRANEVRDQNVTSGFISGSISGLSQAGNIETTLESGSRLGTEATLTPQSSAPVACTAGSKGKVYFDSDINDLCICTGTQWRGALGVPGCQ